MTTTRAARRLVRHALLATLALAWSALDAARLPAQGVTSAAVSGRVTDTTGTPLGAVQIEVVNRATGFVSLTQTRRDGRYFVAGLEVGGPYSVIARRIGYQRQVRDGQTVSLSQDLVVDFRLSPQPVQLGLVTVTPEASPVLSAERTGPATLVSDSLLRRLPTLGRNFTDFLMLVPQVSDAGPGFSAAGANNRYNNIQIDGASENDLFGLGATGQPGGQARGKSIGLEAVKEYQVLLAPFDVRQGNFAGALVNAVTNYGTNEFHGSAFYVTQRAGLSRDVPWARENDFEQTQFGFSVAGPIVRDRAHFFLAPEFQVAERPTPGPSLGSLGTPALVRQEDVDRFASVLQGYGIEAGTPGALELGNPLTNVFARVDLSLPRNHRLVLRHNYGRAEDENLARDAELLRFGSNAYENRSSKQSTVAQLYSHFAGGASTELILGYSTIRDRRRPRSRGPQVQVQVPGTSGLASVALRAGAENSSQGTEVDQDALELVGNATLPRGNHRFTLGTKAEVFRLRNLFAQNSFGSWEFLDLDSLAAGRASRYQVGVGLGGDVTTRFTVAQFAVYGQDRWQATSRLALTYGLRLDVPVLFDDPVYNPAVEAEYGRRTDRVPSGGVQFSPRVGFNWNVTGDRNIQLRGGAGVFTGRPAFVWIGNAFQQTGLGLAQLTCQNTTTEQRTPPFTAGTAANAPTQCADGSGAGTAGDVSLLDADLRFPQVLRATLAYDHRLWWDWVATVEGMYSRGLSAPFYVNRALSGPIGRDRQGRLRYGTIGTTGISSPGLVGARRNVIDVVNTHGDWSYSLTAGLQRNFSNRFEAQGSYTYAQARDVQSLVSSVAVSNWRFGRAVSGDLDDRSTGRSAFELPHRIVLAGTYAFMTNTDLSLVYIGQSGANFDYVYGGSGGRGDLNADGAQGNDLVYVPVNAADENEIRFSGLSAAPGADNGPQAQAARIAGQQQAFAQFIADTDCLSEHRGALLPRNACRTPWTNMLNVSLRQGVAIVRGQTLALQVDVFNFLNLLNDEWGAQPLLPGGSSPVPLLTHVAQTQGGPTGASSSQGIFTFDAAAARLERRHRGSAWQMQVGVRVGW